MFRPTGFADLAGRRVGIFGYGVEGRASAERLAGLAGSLVLVDDVEGRGPDVLVTAHGGLAALATCDVVLKSPGIARRRPDVLELETRGVIVTSALNLWLHEVDRSRVVAITGTKGKSTTTAIITFFLHCLGERAQSVGNIGQPPYRQPPGSASEWLVVEVSSFQCVDIDVAPAVVVVTSLGADHLDWHGSLAQYVEDKLSLTRAAGAHDTLVPESPTFRNVQHQLGGVVSFVPGGEPELAAQLGLLGAHNATNVALALRAVALLTGHALEHVRRVVGELATHFEPLPGRLTLVRRETRDGLEWRYVDDGLATGPLPTVAALAVFLDEPLALIVGGYDRGVDYAPLAEAIARRVAPTLVLTMGAAGRRIGDALRARTSAFDPQSVDSMDDALERAHAFLISGGVVLLSPGAPSFDRYQNWRERSEDFIRAVHAPGGPWSLGGDSNS